MIKNESEIKLMRESGRLLSLVFDYINKLNLLGKSTFEINNIVEKYIIEELCARPASKGQYGFKYVLNPSINDVVCHAIPSEKEILKDGDIINLDITLEKNGYIADSSKTYLIGNVSLSGVVSWNRRNFRHTTRISTCKFFDALDKVSERFVNVFQCLGFRALSTQRLLKTFQIGKPLPMQLI